MGVLLPAFGRPGAWKRVLVLVGLLVAVAVLVTGSPTPAAAGTRAQPARLPGQAAIAEPPAGPSVDEPLTAPDAITAMSIARLENEPVEVMSERTETGQVFALPDGTMAAGMAAGPVRVRVGGDGLAVEDWADIDLTLVAGEDGRIRAAVHPGKLTLSAGASVEAAQEGPVVVAELTLEDGTVSTIGWDGPLPSPRLEGARAVYADVRPGVDMVVEATATGAEQFFVVRERPAAGEGVALPVTIAVDAGAVEAAPDGSFSFVSSAGEAVGSSPQPTMWDAAADRDRVHPVTQPWEPISAPAQRTPPMPAWGARTTAGSDSPGAGGDGLGGGIDAPRSASDDPGRADGGRRGDLGPAMAEQVEVAREAVQVDEQTVALGLVPQEEFLLDPQTEYPVVIDPATYVDAWFDTFVQSGVTANLSANTELLMGTWNGGTTVARSLANFSNTQIAGESIIEAQFLIWEHHSYSCQARSWQVWDTGPASTATTWNAQPTWWGVWATSSQTKGYSSACPDGEVGADITALVRAWAAAPAGTTNAIGLRAASETDSYGWKRFYSTEAGYGPYVWVNYNSKPNAPSGLQVSGSPTPAVSGAWTSTATPVLSATISDPDGGTVNANFRLRAPGATTNLWTGAANGLANGAVGSVQVPGGALLADGQLYEFSAAGSDNIVDGPLAPWFTFGVDLTAPLAPTVSSATHGLVWGATDPGSPGTFTATMPAADPTVVAYRWGMDVAPVPTQQVSVAAGAAGTITATPTTPGRHVLNVQSVDRAGNVSGVAAYGFYVGHGGLIGPDEGAQVVRRTRLTVDAAPGLSYVRFQWRRGPEVPDADIKVVPSADLSTSTGREWPATGWGLLPSPAGYSTWDVGQTLGFEGGPVQVRAQMSAETSGAPVYATQWVTLTVDPDADGAATAAIGPGSVNLLTGDHYLSATDVEEFGLAITRTSSSRDADAGFEMQADKLPLTLQQGTTLASVVNATVTPTVVSDRSHTGGSSLRLVPGLVAPGSEDTYAALGSDGGMPLGVQAGHRYRFTTWVYVPASTSTLPATTYPRAMRMVLFIHTAAGYSEIYSPPPTRANVWQKVTFDATIPGNADGAFVRLYNGFRLGTGQAVYFDDISVRELWAPFGEEWSMGTVDAASGTAYTRVTRPYPDVASVELAGGGEVWFTSGDGQKWWPEPGAEDLSLTSTTTTTWALTELDGTVTTFAQNAATKDFPVQASSPPAAPGASRYVYDWSTGVSRLTRVIAPTEPDIDQQSCTAVTPARGCEVMELTYASATTATASTLGNFAGQVTQVSAWGYDTATGSMTKVAVARYLYDGQGRLTQVYDPRIEAAGNARLTTTYGYDDATDRVTSVTASGEAPWRFTYGTAGAQRTGAGDWVDASTGRLLKVTRASLQPDTRDTWGPDNTTTVVYNVPLTRGAGGPYDLGADALDTWAQVDGPTDATAVFGPETPPGVTTATSSTPGSGGYGKATVHYLNASGREVNTASPMPANGPVQGYIDTAEYDRFGNVTRTLDATNRLLALKALPNATTVLAQWGLETRTSVELAQLLDTRTTYSGDGLDVVRQMGPVQQLVSAETGQVQTLRPTTTTAYDEGKPDAVAYHLPTTVTTSGTDLAGVAHDAVRMRYGYDPINGTPVLGGASGWVHKQATTVTIDAGGANEMTAQVIYDDKGRVIESRRPGANGADAATTQSVYYTAGTNPDNQCGNKPEWAGQPCLTRAGGAVTNHDVARMAGELPVRRVTGYNMFGSPTVVTESVTGPVNGVTTTQTRTATTVYDKADRVVSVSITGTGTGVGASVATTKSIYDDHGDVTEVQSLAANGTVLSRVTREYDALGRLVSYTDADGGKTTTTYDRYGKPISETQTQGAQTIGSRTFAYNATAEPRGFVTSITDSVAGTISATWGPDGQLATETLPGGVTLSIGYDPARVPTSRTYTRSSDGVVIWRDSVVENHRGQWISHASTTGTATYTYDRLGRLRTSNDTLAVSSVCTPHTYRYGTHSNREEFTTATGAANAPCPTTPTTTITSTYDSADRLVSGFGGSAWTYDPLGRITSMPDGDGTGVVSNEFYVNDLIAAQEVPGQARVEWALDPLQRRSTYEELAWVNDAWASSVTKVSHYATDSDEPAWILEDSTLPPEVTRFVSGVEGDLAVTTTLTGGRVVQLVDLHGDVVGTLPVRDGASQATWSGLAYFRADEFGNGVDLGSGSASAGRYGWLGAFQRSGEALGGVILMGVRLYQPATGRFMSVDPVAGGSASAYDYCSADPVNCTDLGGTWGFGSILKVVAAVGEIASNIPGPIGAAAAGVSAVAYAAQGNTAKAIEMGITAAAALVGAGPVVRVAARAVNVARAAGQAVRAAPRLQRAAQGIRSAASNARAAIQRATSVLRRTGCSFESGTLVVLADGSLAPIETLDTGDMVLTTDPLTGETSAQPVITPIVGTGDKHLVDVVTDAGTWTATANHPIWVDGKGWTPAGELAAGDQLSGSAGGLLVVQAMHDRGWFSDHTVYNLSVAGTHTYYIAESAQAAGTLVHNSACSVAGSSSAARREAMRQAGIPTSSQPIAQFRSRHGRAYLYQSNGRQYAVVNGLTDRSHPGAPHWEAGLWTGRFDSLGRPRIQGARGTPFAKSRVFY